jgi:hypothetical protein
VYGDVMGNTLTIQTLVGVFAAMVVVVAFRSKTNRIIELAVWIGLIWVCVIAITHTGNAQAVALTTATIWAAGQIAGMILGVFGQGIFGWISGARFAIAAWVVLLFGVDLLVLALVSTKRQADAWMPGTRLREWMVLPRLQAAHPAPAPVTAAEEINQRFRAWSGLAAAAGLTWATLFVIWLRDVEIPRAALGLKNLALRASNGRLTAASPPLEADVVHIDLLAANAAARKADTRGRVAEAAARPRTRRRSIPTPPQAGARTDKNGSEKHRQGRLAS